jgi:hypothetical protein
MVKEIVSQARPSTTKHQSNQNQPDSACSLPSSLFHNHHLAFEVRIGDGVRMSLLSLSYCWPRN